MAQGDHLLPAVLNNSHVVDQWLHTGSQPSAQAAWSVTLTEAEVGKSIHHRRNTRLGKNLYELVTEHSAGTGNTPLGHSMRVMTHQHVQQGDKPRQRQQPLATAACRYMADTATTRKPLSTQGDHILLTLIWSPRQSGNTRECHRLAILPVLVRTMEQGRN